MLKRNYLQVVVLFIKLHKTLYKCLEQKDQLISLTYVKILIIIELILFDFLLVWRFFVPLDNFSLILRRHHYRWMAANFYLCSALKAIEQWGFLSVPHPLWHGTFVFRIVSFRLFYGYVLQVQVHWLWPFNVL